VHCLSGGDRADRQDVRLRDKKRELVHKGPLKRRGGSREEIADLMGFLFDHAFLLVKPKWVNKAEQYRVYRRVSLVSRGIATHS
jgi:hypothetical protein